MRKTLLMLLVLFLAGTTVRAQLLKPSAASLAFTEKLALITQSFRSNFYQIQGEKLPSQDDLDLFQSDVELPGAQHCVIYRFHSKTDTSASWQGIMYSGDNYNEAIKIYKTNCRLINKCKVYLNGYNLAVYKGNIDNPDTDLRFVSSVFLLNTTDPVYDQFYAEVELVNLNFEQWEVRLNLQSKKDDAEQ